MNTQSLLPPSGRESGSLFAPLQREIDKLFSDFGRSLGHFAVDAPSLDYAETADGVELKLDVPGYKDEDIAVTLDGDVLTISGKTASRTEEDGKTYRLVERRSGSFSRSVLLPPGVDADQIKASLVDGVLTIAGPKQNAPGRTIAIEAKPAAIAQKPAAAA